MNTKPLFLATLVSSLTIAGILYGYDHLVTSPGSGKGVTAHEPNKGNLIFTGYRMGQPAVRRTPPNFVEAARSAIAATVHITFRNRRDANPFNPYAQPGNGSGSGALISQDGYLITNNHVVDGASDIRVALSDRHSFPARLVGTDASNDLAVLKIDDTGLPFLVYGNSEELRAGEWVLAAGYPLDLEATVTAGIISTTHAPEGHAAAPKKKSRNLIQTDAVINHGNSGGPLINAEGELIGINSYFASPTGAYTGYSFAIPVNTVKKVVSEIIARP